MDIDIDEIVYPLLLIAFPGYEEGEILDVVEEFKQPRGLDESTDFDQEVWERYLSLKLIIKREIAGQQSQSLPASHASAAAQAQLPQAYGRSPDL